MLPTSQQVPHVLSAHPRGMRKNAGVSWQRFPPKPGKGEVTAGL